MSSVVAATLDSKPKKSKKKSQGKRDAETRGGSREDFHLLVFQPINYLRLPILLPISLQQRQEEKKERKEKQQDAVKTTRRRTRQ